MRSLSLFGAPSARPASTHWPHWPLLAKGFRPFFLMGALFAALIVPIWLLVLTGRLAAGTHFDPVSWHAHEMVFGFSGAIVAGFLLTAVGNWTGRETATGGPLIGLVALWMLGRFAVLAPSSVPPWLIAVVDLAFLPAFAVAIARPIVAARNKRNAVVLLAVVVLWLANLIMHLDALGALSGMRRAGALVGVDVVTFLMVIITGRVVPMFTKNATSGASIRSHPRADALAAATLIVVTIFDAVPVRRDPFSSFAVLAFAAAVIALRSIHWGTKRSLESPLLWILHAGHAWIVIGLAFRALSMVIPQISPSIGVHAITAGAIGSLTLGMMARVALGHTGRPLVPPPAVTFAFGLVAASAVLRVGAPLLMPTAYLGGLAVSAVAWALAFGVYLVSYAPILVSARADGKPG